MHPLAHRFKQLLERISHVRIYRHSLPHGTDLFHDLARHFPGRPFRVVFDIGANEGQTIALYQAQFPQAVIHAFEPVRALAESLGQKVALKTSTHLHRVAMGAEKGRAAMEVRSNRTSSLVPQGDVPAEYIEEVEITTLNDFAEAEGIRHIDFLKIDAEGYDLKVLQGGQRLLESGAVDFVQVEVALSKHWCLVPMEEFLHWLRPLGYELFGLYEQIPHWSGEPWLHYANAVFVRRALYGAATQPTA